MNTRSENGNSKGIAGKTEERSAISVNSPIFKDVQVTLNAALGQAELSVRDILALKAGAVVKLDAALSDLVELRLNDALVARGEIVAVDGSFGVRIVKIAQLS